MAHNFVLLKAGVKPEDFVNAAMNARETDFIPPAMQDKVIVSKGLVGLVRPWTSRSPLR